MIRKSFTRFRAMAAVVVMVSGVLTFSAAPASAVTYLWSPGGAQAQIDNNPGNGSPSWVWVYSSGWDGHVWVEAWSLNGNYMGTVVEVWQWNQGASANVWEDIGSAYVCADHVAPYGGVYCGGKVYT